MKTFLLLFFFSINNLQNVNAVDADNDGYTADVDCDDLEASINPGTIEICGNWIDDNCDGQVDEYPCPSDNDGDGFFDDVDCDDHDAAIYPGAIEKCGNGIDDNCDGQIEENCLDVDGDGFWNDLDCNDNDEAIHP